MIAGVVVGVTVLKDKLRFTVEEENRESVLEVYNTPKSLWVDIGDYVWTQCGKVMHTDKSRSIKDEILWLIREDWNGYIWTLEEVQGERRYKTA